MNVTGMVITAVTSPQTPEELAPEDGDQPERLRIALTCTNKYVHIITQKPSGGL